jgi:hypothetical protein
MFRHSHSLGFVAVSAVLASLALAPSWMPPSAKGQARNSAQIYIVQGRVPKTAPGANGLANFGRRNHRSTLQETKGANVSERSWLARLIIQFAQPLGDWEYDILYFEVKGSQREHVGNQTVLVSNREEKTFVQRIELKRPDYKPKAKMELVIRVRGREAGKRRFTLAGEEVRIRYSGTVDFTE